MTDPVKGGLSDDEYVIPLIQIMVQSKSAFDEERRDRMLEVMAVCLACSFPHTACANF